MTGNGLTQFFGVTQNEYTILEALYTQILTSDWTHRAPYPGELNHKAVSPICDHLSPYEERTLHTEALQKLLTTNKEVQYGTDDPYGVYLTIKGTNERYSFLWNTTLAGSKHYKIIAYQQNAKRTKNAPRLGYVQGCLIKQTDYSLGTQYTNLFRDAYRVYEEILEFNVLPRTGKEDTLPTPAELLAVLQGYGEYPDIDSVITTAVKKGGARVASTNKSAGLKKNRKKPARAKGGIFWLVFEIALPIILSLIIYGLTEHIMFTAFVGVLAALPILSRGMSLDMEPEGGKSKDSDTSNSR